MQHDYGIVPSLTQKANKPELAILDASVGRRLQCIYSENFDGALFHETSCAGIGVVIRNATGKVVGDLSERINLPPTVEDVEALASRRAIVFAIELGLHRVVFERDSATVINHLQEDAPCLASFGNAIADSISLASQLEFFLPCT
nr:hypothetical protein CFP56_75349 [Quercus suber]